VRDGLRVACLEIIEFIVPDCCVARMARMTRVVKVAATILMDGWNQNGLDVACGPWRLPIGYLKIVDVHVAS